MSSPRTCGTGKHATKSLLCLPRPRNVQGSVDAAASVARQNVQFGTGGRPQVFVPDPYDLMDADLLTRAGRHEFDPSTLRSPIEDPRFSQLDPSLPARPLDPARETRIGQAEGAVVGGGVVIAEEAGSTR